VTDMASFVDPNLLWDCFAHFYHLDRSNAPIHTNAASVKYSPITFRLADAINQNLITKDVEPKHYRSELMDVLSAAGRYELDHGR